MADPTDDKPYSPSFLCGAFAQEVHNNAEARGIRSAWVAIDFKDDPDGHGHALNAFNTVDKGLVFIDCTGNGLFNIVGGTQADADKVAYLAIGQECGVISIEVAASFDYGFYEVYKQKQAEYDKKLEAYNTEVDAYNQALGGRHSLPEPEYSQFLQWAARLNAMDAELQALANEIGDSYWEPLGIVISIEIYW